MREREGGDLVIVMGLAKWSPIPYIVHYFRPEPIGNPIGCVQKLYTT